MVKTWLNLRNHFQSIFFFEHKEILRKCLPLILLLHNQPFIVVRLLRFWDSKNNKKHGEFMGITLFLLDEKCFLGAMFLHLCRRRLVLIDALRTAPSYSGDLKRTVTGFKSTPIFVVARCQTFFRLC